jgi:hypothetical protein
MNFKKVAVASAVSMLFAFSGAANAWGVDFEDIVEDALDEADEISIVAGAANLDDINASINITGSNITFSVGEPNVSASATANAVGTGVAAGEEAAASVGTATASATAIVGNVLSTLAVGAINSGTIEIDAASLMDGATYTYTEVGIESVGSIKLGAPGFEGGDFGGVQIANIGEDTLNNTWINGEDSSTQNITINYPADAVNKLGGNFAGTFYSNDTEIGIVNMAFNTGDIDASVNMIASVVEPDWFLHQAQPANVSLSNISISTMAIGAINSSITRIGVVPAAQ